MVRVWRKLFKIFFNLEELHALLNQAPTLLFGEKEVTKQHKTNQELECFYKDLFTKKLEFEKEDRNACFNQINIPILTEDQSITESELLNALKSMSNNRSKRKR